MAAARDLVKTLRDPQLALESLTDKTIFADVAQMAAKIEEEANQLQEALLRLSPQKKASQNQLGAKVAGIDAAVEKTAAAPTSSSASTEWPGSTSTPNACGRKPAGARPRSRRKPKRLRRRWR